MNRTCSAGSSLNMPVNRVVIVVEPCFRTPRIDMHICSASIITATPRGLSESLIASTISAVIVSCVCKRRA